MPGYFTNSKSEQEIERLMREKPIHEPEVGDKKGKQELIIVKRCKNCSYYSKEDDKCVLSSCAFAHQMKKEPTCKGCPYRNGICNICYRDIS